MKLERDGDGAAERQLARIHGHREICTGWWEKKDRREVYGRRCVCSRVPVSSARTGSPGKGTRFIRRWRDGPHLEKCETSAVRNFFIDIIRDTRDAARLFLIYRHLSSFIVKFSVSRRIFVNCPQNQMQISSCLYLFVSVWSCFHPFLLRCKFQALRSNSNRP